MLFDEVVTAVAQPTRVVSLDTSEKPSLLTARLGHQYARTKLAAHKKEMGQFFTLPDIGEYLAAWATPPTGSVVRVLDPGFGTGLLSCCLVEHFAAAAPALRRIELDAYDLDQQLQYLVQEVSE